jgi:hypothetical protein
MAHYAILNNKNIVTNIIKGKDEMMMTKDSGDLENQIRDLKNQKNELPVEEQLVYDEQINDLYAQIESLPEVELDVTEYWEAYYGKGKKCKRTSFNTFLGTHLAEGIPFRKNYAGIGFYYDEKLDGFIAPTPYNSWVLNEELCVWEAPVAYPDNENSYIWNEEIVNWELVESTIE